MHPSKTRQNRQTDNQTNKQTNRQNRQTGDRHITPERDDGPPWSRIGYELV
ncbi:MAG: hypothetical protein GY861_29180 [bacterium]|nr:hypothetical protein [bacterium]